MLEHSFWSLWKTTKAQGTLLDLGVPLNGPCKANFRGPKVKKGPARSLHGPNWLIFLDRSLDNGKAQNKHILCIENSTLCPNIYSTLER